MISLFERVNIYRNKAFRGKHTTKKFFCIFTATPFFKIVITVLPLGPFTNGFQLLVWGLVLYPWFLFCKMLFSERSSPCPDAGEYIPSLRLFICFYVEGVSIYSAFNRLNALATLPIVCIGNHPRSCGKDLSKIHLVSRI